MRGRYRIYPSLKLLFELVHSLVQGEINKLRELATIRDEDPDKKSYIQFFDLLIKSKHFSKEKILEKYKEQGLYKDAKAYNDAQAYLYHAVLKAIQAYNSDLQGDIFNLSAQIKILSLKGLYHHVDGLYQYAVEFAAQTESFENHMVLLKSKKESLRNTLTAKEFFKVLPDLIVEENEIEKKLLNFNEWDRLSDYAFAASEEDKSVKQKLLNEIREHRFFNGEDVCLSIKAKIRKAFVNEKLEIDGKLNVKSRIPFFKQIIKLIDANPNLLNDSSIVNNYLYAASSIGMLVVHFESYNLEKYALEKLEGLAKHRKEIDFLIFERAEKIRMVKALKSLNIDSGTTISDNIINKLEQDSARFSRKHKLDLIHHASGFNIIIGESRKAVKLINRERNEPPPTEYAKKHFYLWLLYLIAEYELGNLDVLKFSIRDTRNHLKDHNHLGEFEQRFLDFMNELIKPKANSSYLSGKFLRESFPLLNQPEYNLLMNFFDFRKWLQSIIDSKPLLEYYKNDKPC